MLPRIAVAACALASVIASAEEPVLRLCADQWMPYNGNPEDARPGYVIELARAIFQPRGVTVEYTIVPWEEALAAVRECRMHGAIGAGATEAEGMVLPSEPIGEASMCLMTLAGSKWTYENIASFRKGRLGVIKDYEYWPALDAYIARGPGSGIVVVEGDAPLGDLINKLQAGEIDVLAESEPVLLWHLRAHELDRAKFRIVHKHLSEPIYVSFAPNEDGRRFAAMFDEGVRALRTSGELDRLLRPYGLGDWQPRAN